MITIRVPATSANLGPGFDAFGIALDLYNDLAFGTEEELSVLTDYEQLMGRNLAIKAIEIFCEDQKIEMDTSIKAAIKSNVPRARGLGSSATLSVAGIVFANIYYKKNLSDEHLLKLATIAEGHPDNAAPAIFGGFTVSVSKDKEIKYFRTLPSSKLAVMCQVPEFELRTSDSRAALPKVVDHKDAAFNAGHAALLVGAITTGNFDLLKIAMEDKIHQPYRAPLVPGLEEVLEAAISAGAYGACLSGAGPTALAFCPNDYDIKIKISEAMTKAWAKKGINSKSYKLAIDPKGYSVQ